MNVEAQKDYHPGYDLVTRGIFYVARMISAQMDVEFTADDYDGIKKVYSIQPEKIYGDFQGKAILRIRKKLFCRNTEMERERGWKAIIALCREVGMSREQTIQQLMDKCELDRETAESLLALTEEQ